jgi:hypothetical protein
MLVVSLAASSPVAALARTSATPPKSKSLGQSIQRLERYFTGIERRMATDPRTVRGVEVPVGVHLGNVSFGTALGVYTRTHARGRRSWALRATGYMAEAQLDLGVGPEIGAGVVKYRAKQQKPITATGFKGWLKRTGRALGKFVKLEGRLGYGANVGIGVERMSRAVGSDIERGTYRAHYVTATSGLAANARADARVVLNLPLGVRTNTKARRVLDEALTLLQMEGLDARQRAQRIPRLEKLQRKMGRLERWLPAAQP